MTLREFLGNAEYSTRIEVFEEDPKDFDKMNRICQAMSEDLLLHGGKHLLDRKVNFFSPHLDAKGVFIAVAIES